MSWGWRWAGKESMAKPQPVRPVVPVKVIPMVYKNDSGPAPVMRRKSPKKRYWAELRTVNREA